jgi:hypothetical protein
MDFSVYSSDISFQRVECVFRLLRSEVLSIRVWCCDVVKQRGSLFFIVSSYCCVRGDCSCCFIFENVWFNPSV